MTNEKGPRVGGVAARAAGQDIWSLEGEKLSRRVPRFAAFVEAIEGGEGALTNAQREFLDKFSSGLAEATLGEKQTRRTRKATRMAELPDIRRARRRSA